MAVVGEAQITLANVNDGSSGASGVNSYTFIAYANSSDGSIDFSRTDSDRDFIGTLTVSQDVNKNLLLYTGEDLNFDDYTNVERQWGVGNTYADITYDGNVLSGTVNKTTTNETTGVRFACVDSNGDYSWRTKSSTNFGVDMQPGDVFTFSSDIKTDGNIITLVAQYYNGSNVWVKAGEAIFTPEDDDWHRYSLTFTIPDDFVCFTAFPHGVQPTLGITSSCKNWKLEKGDTASDWSAAPEDLANDYNNYTWKMLKADTVTSVTNYYLASDQSSGVTTSTSGWQTDFSNVTLDVTNRYLWNYEETVYSVSGTKATNPRIIGVYGDTGADGEKGDKGDTGATGLTGKSLESITEYYLATDASSGVTTSTSGWTTTIQTMTSSKQYLWNYELLTWTETDGSTTTSTTDPIIIGRFGKDGIDNLLYDANESVWTPVNAPSSKYRRYTSDGGNSTITSDIVACSDPPHDGIDTVYQLVNDGTNTANTFRGVAFYSNISPTYSDGKVYTLSAWYRCTDGVGMGWTVCHGVSAFYKNANQVNEGVELDSNWRKLSVTFKAYGKYSAYTEGVGGRAYFKAFWAAGEAGTVQIADPKLVEGYGDDTYSGGRNLLNFTVETVTFNIDTTTEQKGFSVRHAYGTTGCTGTGNGCNTFAGTNPAGGGLTLEELGFKAGDQLVITFDWEVSATEDTDITYGTFWPELYYTDGTGGTKYYAKPFTPSDSSVTMSEDNSSGHCVCFHCLRPLDLGANTLSFRVDNSVLDFTISNCKLEAGNVPSDWTEAPEDTNRTITDISESLNDSKTEVEQIKEEQEELIASNAELRSTVETMDQHFWWDSDGAHVTHSANDATSGRNALLSSIALHFRNGTDDVATFGDDITLVNGDNKLVITATALNLMSDNQIVAFLSQLIFVMKNARVEEKLEFGGFAFIPRSNGNMSLKYIGEEE